MNRFLQQALVNYSRQPIVVYAVAMWHNSFIPRKVLDSPWSQGFSFQHFGSSKNGVPKNW